MKSFDMSFSKYAAAALALGCALFFSFCKNEKTPDPNAATANPELLALTKQLELDPKNDSLRYRRAEVFYELEGYDEAIADLRAALAVDSLQPKYYHLLADVFLDYAKSFQAVRAMEAAVYKFPDRIPTLLKMSEFYLIVKKHSDALATLDKILKRDPQNADAYFLAGRVALDMGDEDRAIKSLRKSVQINSENAEAWEFLGRIFSNKKDPLALQYFDNALRIDSANNEIRVFKGMAYFQRGEHGKAFEVYRDVIHRDPNHSDAWFDMGIMYLELDSLDKAHEHFNIAVKTDPLFVKAYYYRGVVAEEKDNLPAAIADYRQANKMSPNFPEAKEALERLGQK